MNKLLSAALAAASLALAAGPALADEAVRETRPVDAKVTKVKLGGVVDLVVLQGPTPSLEVLGDRRYIQRVTTVQRGDTLEIGTESFSTRNERVDHKLRAVLTVPNLAEFTSNGVGSSTVNFNSDTVKLALDGAGAVAVHGNFRQIDARLGGVGAMSLKGVNAERIDLNLRGAGRMTVQGQARLLQAKLSGVGSLEAQGLQADTVDLALSGLGGASVHAKQAADVSLSGLGSATVYGNPAKRHASDNGLGSISWK
jgi:hypothetical protein